MDSKLKTIATDVFALPTAPYYEHAVAAYIRRFAKRRGLKVKADRFGNLVVRYKHGNKAPKIAIAAHMDHPGFEVLEADGAESKAAWLGGCDPQHFPDSRVAVMVDGEAVDGIVTTKLGEGKVFGIRTQKPVNNATGVFGMWRLAPVDIQGDRIRTRAADNLAGCVTILHVLDRLARERAKADFRGVFTRAEEVGFVGAAGLVEDEYLPKSVPLIVLEASMALPGAEIGNGVVIRVGDAASIFDPRVEYAMSSTARKLAQASESFRFQRQLMSGGTCEATLYVLHGMTVGALALPLGAYHNQGGRWPAEEEISAGDLQTMADFCFALAMESPLGETRKPLKKRMRDSSRSKRKRLIAQPLESI